MNHETWEFIIESLIKELGSLRFSINQLSSRQTETEKKMSDLETLIQQDTTELSDLQTVLSQGFDTLAKKILDQDTLITQLQNTTNNGTAPTQAQLDALTANNATLAVQTQNFRDFLAKTLAPVSTPEPAPEPAPAPAPPPAA